MKELTIEEKAKAYDEALERAKVIYQGSYKPDTAATIAETLQNVFPELCESEDERIRKELIEYIKDQQSSFISAPDCRDKYEEEENNKYNSWLAWLEKQGKSDKIVEKAKTEKQRVLVTEFDGSANIDWDCRSLDDAKRLLECGLQYINTELEKQGEQKHADIKPKFKVKYAGSEYNVLEIKEIAGVTYYVIEDEPNHIDHVKAENCEIVGDHSYGVKEKGSPYPTKSATFTEQKHPDWNEEDEKMMNSFLHKVEVCNLLTNKESVWITNKLKSLKPQPQQEWSEEDKDILNGITSYLCTHDACALDGFDKWYDWLQSLKPQTIWKPSEEQVKAFEHFVRSIGESGYASPYENNTKLLRSLLEQLKKL